MARQTKASPKYFSKVGGSNAQLGPSSAFLSGGLAPPADTAGVTLGKTMAAITDHFVQADQVNELGKARAGLYENRLRFLQNMEQEDPRKWKEWEPKYREMMAESKNGYSDALPASLAGKFTEVYDGINKAGLGAVTQHARNSQIAVTMGDPAGLGQAPRGPGRRSGGSIH